MISERMIIEPLLPQWPELEPTVRKTIAHHAMMFVHKSIALAPAHMRVAVIVVSVVLYAWIFLYAVVFGRSAARQRKAISLFQRLPGPAPAVVRLYQSLTVLAFYEHPLVRQAMNAEDPIARRDRFRALRETRLTPTETM